jgi:phage terminase large subunit-like protein
MPIQSNKDAIKVKLRMIELEKKINDYKETHKIESFKPLPYQAKVIEFIKLGKKTVLFQGANRIGKTLVGVNLAGAFSLGCKIPWGSKDELYPSEAAKVNKGRKVIGRIVVNDWEKAARDTIVPKLKEWLPLGTYETKKNNVGVEHEFVFPKTGSKFSILTYKEDTKSHEGWTGDWVWFDEPPPKDKYRANRRGLVSTSGLVFISMTALDQPWILDDIALANDPTMGVIGDIPMKANPYLNQSDIDIYANSCTDDEKIACIEGGWLQLSGRIWKGFNKDIHVVDPFKIPPDWPVQFQIDFHLNLPHAIIFYAVDHYNRLFFFNEVWENMGTEDLANEIIRVKQSKVLRLDYGEIDALSKGDTSYIKNRFGKAEDSFTIITRILAQRGIKLGVGSKDEKSYIRAVETKLKGENGMPTLFIFRDCPETIKQVQRWSYDDFGTPKSDGHFPECIGRATQTGLKYTPYRRFPVKQQQISVGAFT